MDEYIPAIPITHGEHLRLQRAIKIDDFVSKYLGLVGEYPNFEMIGRKVGCTGFTASRTYDAIRLLKANNQWELAKQCAAEESML